MQDKLIDNKEEIKDYEKKYLEILSENISRIRKKKGLTIQQLSDITELSVNYIAKISSNSSKTKKIPTLSTLLKISKALDVPPSFLLISDKEELKGIIEVLSKDKMI